MMPYAIAYVIAAVVSFRLLDSLNQMLSSKTDHVIHRYYVIKLVICAIFWPISWIAMITVSALALIIVIIRYSIIKITATHKGNNH